MPNTNCEKCIFSNPVDSATKACEFDIPEKITKEITISNGFNVIKDYKCLYGFGKEQAKELPLETNVKNLILEKAQLKYYPIVDLRNLDKDSIRLAITELNNLEVKPAYISLIVDPNNPDYIYELIKNELICKKWKMHVQVDSISFNDCINLILDTNLAESKSWCVLFINYSKMSGDRITINGIVKQLQEIFIIKQENFYGVTDDKNDLHLLCLNARLYKHLTSVLSNDILQGLSLMKEISLINYEF